MKKAIVLFENIKKIFKSNNISNRDFSEESKIIKTLKESNLVDEEFYLSQYEDVKRRKVDPVYHYVRYGCKENRWPNKYFDTELVRKVYHFNDEQNILYQYLNDPNAFDYRISNDFDGKIYYYLNPDVKEANVNPLFHFINYGKGENRKYKKDSFVKSESNISHHKDNNFVKDVSMVKVTIIVPVFNALNETMDCIDSIISNTILGDNVQLLIINDGSTDKSISIELEKYTRLVGVVVVNNDFNLGYTGTINKGIELAGDSDVVLLNSYNIVTPHWIRNLTIAAYSDDSIGTVTAVSNNAGAFSVPAPGFNKINEQFGIQGTARLVSQLANDILIDTPTGNGFCLFIKRKLIKDIGYFDVTRFPRGYGEENEFCMRALDYGWSNVICPKVYIYHKRSASFQDEKKSLIISGVDEVKLAYPQYDGAIKAIGQSKIFSELREKIKKRIDDYSIKGSYIKNKILFVISTRTGGTPQTNLDLMMGLSELYDCYALASDTEKLQVLNVKNGEYNLIEEIKLINKITFANHHTYEYEKVVKSLLIKYDIDLVHIRHLAWHSLNLPKIAKNLNIPVVKSFHDFYAICPTVNLIDDKGNLSIKGVSENGLNPLWNDVTVKPINAAYLRMWQKRMEEKLSYCDYFVTTSDSAKEIIKNTYRNINRFKVIPHGRNFEEFIQPRESISIYNDKIKILLPGNISLSKGKNLVKEIKKLDSDSILEFHVLGHCDEDLLPYVIYHGKYKRSDFQARVRTIRPTIAAIFSIWPETYCHTLTECWASGLPVVGLSYGAVEERINKHGGGWLVKNNPYDCYSKIISIVNDNKEINNKIEDIIRWQKEDGLYNNVKSMSEKYIEIYRLLLSEKTIANLPVKRKMGFVLKGDFPDVPPTAYVRLVDWKSYFEKKSGLKVDFISWKSILTKSLYEYEEFVIQRDAIPLEYLDICLDSLKNANIKYTYEIDDNLLDVPEEIDTDGGYLKYKNGFITLIRNAKEVHVTNNELAKIIRKYNSNVMVRPNVIFKERWDLSCIEEEIKLGLESNKVNVLYYGSKTHQRDLDFILEVISKLNKKNNKFTITVIGCGKIDNKYSDFANSLTPPSSRYDLFIEWLKKISNNFDIGVAPLIDENFSKTKSYLKCLELKALGLKVVCSDIKPYSELKKSNRDDYLIFVDNNVENWIAELEYLGKAYDR